MTSNDLLLARRFDVEAVRKTLDAMTFPEVCQVLQAPETITVYAEGLGRYWTPGDGRPSLADEDPAVMAAIARCALNRFSMGAGPLTGSLRTFTVSHPARCGWCDYPRDELLRALEWSVHHSRLIASEHYVWRQGTEGAERFVTYTRPGTRAGTYENPQWAIFAAKDRDDQAHLVMKAVEDSAAMLELEGKREHDPWCRYEPDHGGDCSDRPEERSAP